MRNTNLPLVLSRWVAAVTVVVGLLACPIHAQVVISEFMADICMGCYHYGRLWEKNTRTSWPAW